MDNTLVSVIVPVYNVCGYVRRCIESIISQSHADLEIILVDDGSNDGSSEICDEMGNADPRIKVIHQQNEGTSSARNAGLQICTGSFISFVDGDDYIDPDMIRELLRIQREYDADIVQCNTYWIQRDGSIIDAVEYEQPKTEVFDRTGINMLLVKPTGQEVVVWNKLYKRYIFDGLRFPLGKFHEDEYVFYKALDKCNVIARTSKQLYYYVSREGSTMNSLTVKHRIMYLEAIKERLEYFRQRGNTERAFSTYETALRELLSLKERYGNSPGYRDDISEFRALGYSIVFAGNNIGFLIKKTVRYIGKKFFGINKSAPGK